MFLFVKVSILEFYWRLV